MIGIMADFVTALPNAGETLPVEPCKLEGAADRCLSFAEPLNCLVPRAAMSHELIGVHIVQASGPAGSLASLLP